MRARPLLAAVAVLVAGAAVAAGDLLRDDAPRAARSAAFQDLVGGLGAGTALDLAGCAGAFDPRVAAGCAHRHEPLPGGDALCPFLGPVR